VAIIISFMRTIGSDRLPDGGVFRRYYGSFRENVQRRLMFCHAWLMVVALLKKK
jgi:hypothetical protein